MAIFYKITHEEPDFDLDPGRAGVRRPPADPRRRPWTRTSTSVTRRPTTSRWPCKGWLQANATTASGEHALASLLDMEAPTHPAAAHDRSPRAHHGGRYRGPRLVGHRPGPARHGDRPDHADTVRPASGAADPAAGHRGTGHAGHAHRRGRRLVLGHAARHRAHDGAPGHRSCVRSGRRPGAAAARAAAPGSTWPSAAWSWPSSAPAATSTFRSRRPRWRRFRRARPTAHARRRDASAHRGAAHAPARHGRAAADLRRGHGQGRGRLRTAQAAFRKGDYDRALKSAQGALAEDPANKGAKDLVQRALEGQKAEDGPTAAQAALAKGDFAAADRSGGREPAGALGRPLHRPHHRVREAQATAQREAQDRKQREAAAREQQQKQAAAGKINELLSKADDAIGKSQYDAAIQLYDEVLKLDANNSRAASGKTNAIGARAVAQAAARGASGRRQGVRPRQDPGPERRDARRNAPPGFEDTAGVASNGAAPRPSCPARSSSRSSPTW